MNNPSDPTDMITQPKETVSVSGCSGRLPETTGPVTGGVINNFQIPKSAPKIPGTGETSIESLKAYLERAEKAQPPESCQQAASAAIGESPAKIA